MRSNPEAYRWLWKYGIKWNTLPAWASKELESFREEKTIAWQPHWGIVKFTLHLHLWLYGLEKKTASIWEGSERVSALKEMPYFDEGTAQRRGWRYGAFADDDPWVLEVWGMRKGMRLNQLGGVAEWWPGSLGLVVDANINRRKEHGRVSKASYHWETISAGRE